MQRYIENVKQDTNIGSNILRVSASDEDADNNGAIRYSLTAPFDPADINYFDIHPESGWIYLRKALDVSTRLFFLLLRTLISFQLSKLLRNLLVCRYSTPFTRNFWEKCRSSTPYRYIPSHSKIYRGSALKMKPLSHAPP